MTDNHDQWSNPYGSANHGVAGGYPPQAPYQQPAYPDPGQAWGQPVQQGWGQPEQGQQGWGQPAYPPIDPNQPQGYQQPGYQPTQQFYPGQADPNFPGQQPVPGYGRPPAPGGPNRTWLILGAVAAVLVLVGGGIAAYALTRDDSGSTSAAPTSTAGAPPTSKGGNPSTSKGGSPSPTPSGSKPGGRTVVAPALGISYDVPAGWTISAPTQTSTQSGADGVLIGYARSSEGDNYCPGSAFRSLAFVAQLPGTDLGAAATKAAKIAIEGGYDDPTGGKPGAPVAVTTTSGMTGQQVETSGPWKPTQPGCTTNGYSVYTFAFAGPRNATLVMTVLADRGTTGELPADQAKQMIASLRTS
ncbi:hypothetical protein [Nocardia sp. CDC160]|uniref:hypothetical protein n=1 Tax=Nocardia sp. CDC160 TaxID=3112166 RepID=UPI002DB614EC|nr:hypothetical protein [Nocardia sp. CDC160]MEC3914462.1 hypothetical protein [Nocardia sp. CDC160]